MYAPKKSFFFDFDKMTPRLATRWGGSSLRRLAVICFSVWCGVVCVVWCVWCVCDTGDVQAWVTIEELFLLNRYARAINMYVRMKHQWKCKQT